MAEHKPLYRGSFSEAVRLSETDQWRASWHENVACRDFIDQSIHQNYGNSRLNGDVAGDAIAEYGYDRVSFVLANTIRLKDHDGRFSATNKEWAQSFYFEADDIHRHDWVIDQSHPGLVDIVTNQARQAYDQLHLFDAAQCITVHEFQDVTGHVLVLRPEVLKDEYKTPESQLFMASHGNGCRADAIGRSIFGKFLVDGERTSFQREHFLGVLKAELLPEWAIEKMLEPEPEHTQEPARIRVFQINRDRDDNGQCFRPLKEGRQHDSFSYDEVYNGLVPDTGLEQIFEQFNNNPPPLHRGWSMSVSDIIEVQGRYHYVNPVGFEEVEFEPSLTQKPGGLLRVVMIEPGLPAYVSEIRPDLEAMQRAVGGGLIEMTYPFEDEHAVMVGNEEAKLIGMDGNRHLNGAIYAGPLFIIGDDGQGGFCSLTDEQVAGYCQDFAVPEEITMEEVQADMRIEFHAWG